MSVKIEKTAGTGFCFGVTRAIAAMEKVAQNQGTIETLGAPVHNKQVLKRLADKGVKVVKNIDELQGNSVVVGAHGVGPETEAKITARNIKIIDTTCRFVNRAQTVAKRFSDDGFFVIVYGDANHPEVKGILSWTGGKGVATLDAARISEMSPLPKKLGVLSQTTQIPANFNDFLKNLVDIALAKDSELYIIDTICHDIRRRQTSARKLAEKVDLMFVVGDHTSANTNRLAELCAKQTHTHLVETAADIKTDWLEGHMHIGVTGGASTAEETIDEVIARLEQLTCKS